MLFRKIGRQFSGMIHEYMFDEFLFFFFTACMKFESCSCAFMIYGLFVSLHASNHRMYISTSWQLSLESWVLADTWFLFLLEEYLSGL
jgi:hypothetical protein